MISNCQWVPQESVEYEVFFTAAAESDVWKLEAVITSNREIGINASQGDGLDGLTALHISSSMEHT